MEIKYLIVDLDDTLVDDKENHRGAYKYITKKLDIPYREEEFQKWLEFDSYYWHDYYKSIKVPEEYNNNGTTWAKYLRGMRFSTYFGDIPYGPMEIQDLFQEGLKDNIVALPYAVETIISLSTKYPIYISTNGDSIIAKEKIRRIGLEGYIKGIFSADMTQPPAEKSKLEYYKQLLEFINFNNAKECLVIGDNYRDDALIPNKAGFKTCWIHTGKEDNLVCDYQLESIKELKTILL